MPSYRPAPDQVIIKYKKAQGTGSRANKSTGDSLEKTLMLGKTEGGRKRGRQRMRWLDGITDSMAENQEPGGARLDLAEELKTQPYFIPGHFQSLASVHSCSKTVPWTARPKAGRAGPKGPKGRLCRRAGSAYLPVKDPEPAQLLQADRARGLGAVRQPRVVGRLVHAGGARLEARGGAPPSRRRAGSWREAVSLKESCSCCC
ncbi:TPA: hypothetical protein BOS_9418 [Bos taurus]|nr:TPA: hypothetical protein BOS_9418 [Bos taurus]